MPGRAALIPAGFDGVQPDLMVGEDHTTRYAYSLIAGQSSVWHNIWHEEDYYLSAG